MRAAELEAWREWERDDAEDAAGSNYDWPLRFAHRIASAAIVSYAVESTPLTTSLLLPAP